LPVECQGKRKSHIERNQRGSKNFLAKKEEFELSMEVSPLTGLAGKNGFYLMINDIYKRLSLLLI